MHNYYSRKVKKFQIDISFSNCLFSLKQFLQIWVQIMWFYQRFFSRRYEPNVNELINISSFYQTWLLRGWTLLSWWTGPRSRGTRPRSCETRPRYCRTWPLAWTLAFVKTLLTCERSCEIQKCFIHSVEFNDVKAWNNKKYFFDKQIMFTSFRYIFNHLVVERVLEIAKVL